jgi:hypothetical protein
MRDVKSAIWVVLPLAFMSACGGSGNGGDVDAGAGSDTDADTDGDSDTDADTDTDAEADGGADGGALPDMPAPSFLVGYNEGWFNTGYGTDLSANFDLEVVKDVFDGILTAGGSVVRLWLFEFREGIAIGDTVPQTQGVDPAMLDNLELVLDAARERGLWVYLTALEGNEIDAIADTDPALKDYYWNLLNNEYGEGDAYDTLVLAPLLERLDAHQDVVYGLDLMNEIEAPRSAGMWTDPVGGPRAWMESTAAFVKSLSPWIRVTSTAGWSGAQWDIAGGFFSGLGLDFYDLHMYSDDGSYDGATAVCDRAAADGVPVILGEFGQLSEDVVDDTLQYDVTGAFLYTAQSLCFEAAIAWRYDYGPSCWDFVREDATYRPAVEVMQLFGAMP